VRAGGRVATGHEQESKGQQAGAQLGVHASIISNRAADEKGRYLLDAWSVR
jgi:hypothetical protein